MKSNFLQPFSKKVEPLGHPFQATQGTGIAGAIADKQHDRDIHACGEFQS
jgi:hypothetical protein